MLCTITCKEATIRFWLNISINMWIMKKRKLRGVVRRFKWNAKFKINKFKVKFRSSKNNPKGTTTSRKPLWIVQNRTLSYLTSKWFLTIMSYRTLNSRINLSLFMLNKRAQTRLFISFPPLISPSWRSFQKMKLGSSRKRGCKLWRHNKPEIS